MGAILKGSRFYRLHVVADLDFLLLELPMHAEDKEHDAQLERDRHPNADSERRRGSVPLPVRVHMLVHTTLHEHVEKSDNGGKHLPEIPPDAKEDAEAR